MEGSFECPPLAGEMVELKMCRCGRAPHRKGQRNCHVCNREANRKYRAELKRMERRLLLIRK